MNLNEYKFIVGSGCSYGTTLSSLENNRLSVKLDTDENLIFIQVSCASQGSDWIYDSTIYTIQKLLSIGIKSENIYCFVEWTQLDRITITQPTILHEFFNTNFAREKTNRHFYIKASVNTKNNLVENTIFKQVNSIIDELYNTLNILSLQDVHNVMSIEKLWYINPTHTDINDVLKFDNIDFEMSYKEMLEYEIRIPIETRVKKYLNNILNLQMCLNGLGIKYNFVPMQSQFSGWDMDSDYNPIHKYTILKNKPTYITYTEPNKIYVNSKYKENLNITDADDLVNVFPQFKYLINQIDFSKWWFHKSDFYRYGGFDEYAIETYGLYGFLSNGYAINNNSNNIDLSHIIPSFGYHPHDFIHILLCNDMMFNNPFFKVNEVSIKRVKSMVDEDIQAKTATKYNLSISKQELEKHIILI